MSDGRKDSVGDDLMRQMGAFFQNSQQRARSSVVRRSTAQHRAAGGGGALRLSSTNLAAGDSPRRRGIMPPHISAVSAAGLNRFSDSESDGEPASPLPRRSAPTHEHEHHEHHEHHREDRASIASSPTVTPRESDDWSTDVETAAEWTFSDGGASASARAPGRAAWVGAGKAKVRSASAPAQQKRPSFQFGAAAAADASPSSGGMFVFGQAGDVATTALGGGSSAAAASAAASGGGHNHSSSSNSLGFGAGPSAGAGHRRVASTPASSSMPFSFDGGFGGGGGCGAAGPGGTAAGAASGGSVANDAAREALAALVADAASPGHWLAAPAGRSSRRGSAVSYMASSRRGSALGTAQEEAAPATAPPSSSSSCAPRSAPRVSEVAAGVRWVVLCAVHEAPARAILDGARKSLAGKRGPAGALAAAGACYQLHEITHLFGRKPGDPEHEQLQDCCRAARRAASREEASTQILILCSSGRIMEGDDAWHMIEPDLVPAQPNARRRCLSKLRGRRIFVSHTVATAPETTTSAGQLVLCKFDGQN
jgi:hypothetical protein